MRYKYVLLKRQIAYDLKNGIAYQYKKYLFFILIIMFLFLLLNRKVSSYNLNLDNTVIGFWDYLIYLYRGKEVIGSMSQVDIFELPIEWLLIHSYFLLAIGTYPKVDYGERGHQFLIRLGNKWYWWFSKGIYIIVSVLLYYTTIIVIAFGFAGISRGSLQKVSLDICYQVLGFDISNLTKSEIVWGTCVMPVIVLMALGIIEMVLSFITSSMVSLIVLLGYLSVSAYWLNELLLGNYTMLLRIKSVSNVTGITISCVCIIIFFGLGYFYFKQLDLIGKRREEIA